MMVSLLAGCGGLPTSGPYSVDVNAKSSVSNKKDVVEDKTAKPDFRYALVDVSNDILPVVKKDAEHGFDSYDWPDDPMPEIIKISVGDTISITIYEAQSGGLFIPTEAGVRPGNFVTLPPQTIDKSGYITVPYVGLVQAAGKSTNSVANAIKHGLQDRAIEPQVIVTITQRESAEVSVIGQVKSARKFALSYKGDKILDAIAQAGGPDVPGYDAYVSLQRGDHEYTIPFDALVLDPKKNIYLHEHDTVYVYSEPKNFLMFGAFDLKGNFSFDKRQVMLSEAIGKARGMNDDLADPSEVYIYRREPAAVVNAMGLKIDYSHFKAAPKDGLVPVIYKVNLREPDGFFLAQQFPVSDKDVIYIANAESVEFTKFLNLLSNTSTTTTDAHNAWNAVMP